MLVAEPRQLAAEVGNAHITPSHPVLLLLTQAPACQNLFKIHLLMLDLAVLHADISCQSFVHAGRYLTHKGLSVEYMYQIVDSIVTARPHNIVTLMKVLQ